MERGKLKVLREADYVIAPNCGACEHARYKVNGEGRCFVLNVHVDLRGRCKFFNKDAAIPVNSEYKSLMEKRVYSRSNRHKTTPRY